ncbi:exodeoxyribonuclease V subunit beta [Acidithiobacillus sp. AMEEHan]|uniref:exodeoxyribonuclease V subunit beta n=1 Tax=Acidithiobacillus sp. AMEEHan TaxID=2994951 RepID=UPI0027E4F906|nr:exodeoxyribonuclease V subunit beta [Acidithiobacillus sp. AMEEHan]
MTDSDLLDPLRFPLRAGRRLIEASAGTGKTYTIAALYLRLVLGHDCARPFLPEEILVMTFTNAATLELRARIRRRLHEAAGFFAGQNDNDDEFLRQLRNGYPPEAWPRLARLLDGAAEGMDQAAIFTIHAWAQRVLQEYAFASGNDFALQVLTDERTRAVDLLQDYLRLFLHPLPYPEMKELRRWGKDLLDPEAFLGVLREYLDRSEGFSLGEAPAVLLHRLWASATTELARLRMGLAEQLDSLEHWLDELCSTKQVDGRKLNAGHFRKWMAGLRAWTAQQDLDEPSLTDSAWHRLSLAGMQEAQRGGGQLTHPALLLIEELHTYLHTLQEQREEARAALLTHALAWIDERKQQLREERGEIDFQGILRQLRNALQGDAGRVLATRLAEQYPWALVDEFQDTDPYQYAILDTIYRSGQAEGGLLLIGDPKQSIYRFRGGDLHTYLRAQRDCGTEIYRLGRNYRSSEQLVAALNAFFVTLEARCPQGVFGLRQGEENPVPYLPVDAAGLQEEFFLAGEELPALQFAVLAEDVAGNKGEYTDCMAAACAERIVALLLAARSGRAGFRSASGQRTLQPADLAVLVNERAEADKLRAALRHRGIASVYLSEQQSVYDSPEAADLERLLTACLAYDDEQAVGTALATSLLGLAWSELAALRHDDRLREERLLQFRRYAEIWRERGVLPMLLRLSQDFSLPARLLHGGVPGGERRLTNFLHLAELLQHAAQELQGEHAVLRFLAEQRQSSAGRDEETLLRLESDAALVRVITIHKSKGLQYPVVFLPFMLNARTDSGKRLQITEERGKRALRPADAAEQERAERERLQEDIRKLYVALTRAQFAVWVGVGSCADAQQSALAQLLLAAAEEGKGSAELVQDLFAHVPQIGTTPIALPDPPSILPPQIAPAPEWRPRIARVQENDWWIASYSALQRGHHHPVERFAELWEEEQTDGSVEPATHLLFPPGAATGILLHDLLRWMAEQGFAAISRNPHILREEILRRSHGQSWAQHASALQDWLLRILALPLTLAEGETVRLQDLQEYQAEMEFWLPVQNIDSGQIDRIVNAFLLPDLPRPALDPRRLGGMFKGFIDLVFFWKDRFYLIDYKSNVLGLGPAAYTPLALSDALLAQRYDLQLGLYLVALQRLLRSRGWGGNRRGPWHCFCAVWQRGECQYLAAAGGRILSCFCAAFRGARGQNMKIPALDCRSGGQDALRRLLCEAVEQACLRPWDAQFALFLRSLEPAAPSEVLLAAALCSKEAAQGQVYLDLLAEAIPENPFSQLWWPRFAEWKAWLHQWPSLLAAGEGTTPLVLSEGRLYLRRFWQDEQRIVEGVRARLVPLPLPAADLVAAQLDRLFAAPSLRPDWQRIACTLMLRHRLGVISGGPGTGKTTTVLRLLLLLQGLALQGALPQAQGPLRIRLAAPTGKAAARLSQSLAESLDSQAQDLARPEVIAQIPRTVETVHRLLGLRADGRARHHRGQMLAADLLVIDEASMLSQELMARILDALTPSSRLILLGDKDQLASVEAGAVLAELCADAELARYDEDTRRWIAATAAHVMPAPETVGSAREQSVALLRHSYRFSASSGIGRLAEQIRRGQDTRIAALLDEPESDLRCFVPANPQELDALLLHGWGEDQTDAPGYLHFFRQMQAGLRRHLPPEELARQCLQAFSEFQVLCARRDGPWGVDAMNRQVTRLLQRQGVVPPNTEWFAGRPVIVTRNLYALQLMNGEVGITLPLRLADGRTEMRVAFAGASGEIRWFSPLRLRDVETVFALTVHKSQGSEYRHCAFLAAMEERDFLHRELLYTAVTRARSRLSLAMVGGQELLHEMVAHPLRRRQRMFSGERYE